MPLEIPWYWEALSNAVKAFRYIVKSHGRPAGSRCRPFPLRFLDETELVPPACRSALARIGRRNLLQEWMRSFGFFPCFISLSLMQTTVSQVISKALPRGSAS